VIFSHWGKKTKTTTSKKNHKAPILSTWKRRQLFCTLLLGPVWKHVLRNSPMVVVHFFLACSSLEDQDVLLAALSEAAWECVNGNFAFTGW